MAKYFKNVGKTHVPFEPDEQREIDQEENEFLDEVQEAGAYLQELRVEKGWSEKDLGRQVNVDSAEIQRMEAGQQPIPLTLAKTFATLFGTDYRKFL